MTTYSSSHASTPFNRAKHLVTAVELQLRGARLNRALEACDGGDDPAVLRDIQNESAEVHAAMWKSLFFVLTSKR